MHLTYPWPCAVRLEAQPAGSLDRERWGGVWRADRYFTLTGITSNQTSVREITFDVWPDKNRRPKDVVPWISRGTHPAPEPVLSVSVAESMYWWGFIISDIIGTGKTGWISGTEAAHPDTVLYWLRED